MGKQWVWYAAIGGLLWYLFVYKPSPSALARAKAASTGVAGPAPGNTSEPEHGAIAQQAIANGIGVPFTNQNSFYSGAQHF